MNLKKSLSNWAILLFAAASFITCQKQESPDPTLPDYVPTAPAGKLSEKYSPPAITFSTQIQGFVQDVAGNPVPGAEVTAGGKTILADNYGAFIFTDAAFTGDFCYIKAVKRGYFTGSTTIHGSSGSKYQATLVMQAQDNIVQYNATEAKAVQLPNGAQADFLANAIIKSDGSAYTGVVNVSIAHLDPSAENFSSLIPGGDLRAFDQNQQDVALYSFGMLNIELRDDQGNMLQLADGKEATLTMPVPADMLGKAPATIPLWYFDEEKGVWFEEGSATLQGTKYVGNVKHFTPWNCDRPYPPSIIHGTALDCNGEPMPMQSLKVDQTVVATNNKGEFKQRVGAELPYEVSYYEKSTGKHYTLSKGIASAGNTKKELGNLQFTKCVSKVTGTFTDCNNKPFTGYGVLKYNGQTKMLNITDGVLSVYVDNVSAVRGEIFIHQPSTQAMSYLDFTMVPEGETAIGTKKICNNNGGGGQEDKLGVSFTYIASAETKSYTFNEAMIATAIFSASKNKTTVVYVSKSMQDSITITFPGNQPGGPFLGTGGKPLVKMSLNNGKVTFTGNGDIVSVAKYGSNGNFVTGTFSGQFLASDNPWLIPSIVTVSGGKFTVMRLPDTP